MLYTYIKNVTCDDIHIFSPASLNFEKKLLFCIVLKKCIMYGALN